MNRLHVPNIYSSFHILFSYIFCAFPIVKYEHSKYYAMKGTQKNTSFFFFNLFNLNTKIAQKNFSSW